jgi:3-oxoacyl-[acyl-carrier-protein] synthase-3
MFINSTGFYVPAKRIPSSYFAELNNSSEEWYFKRTGILTRSRANEEETINYMCIEAVKKAAQNLPYDIKEVDLIIFASYTPQDTVATTAHIVQREFVIDKAKAFYISSACSSAINGMEIINSFFKNGIASKALLLAADKNSAYSKDTDMQSGHLWGDGAAAFFFSAEAYSPKEPKLIDIDTKGLGHISQGPNAVYLNLLGSKILEMPIGKDVFTQACIYLTKMTKNILKKNNFPIEALSYFVGHQANKRILTNVCEKLGISEDKAPSNIEEYGNTGCASALIVYAQNQNKFKSGDLICIATFGGGYSAGVCLLKFQEN